MRPVRILLITILLTGCVLARTRDPSEAPRTAKQALLNGVGVFDGQSKVPAADALADLEDFQQEGALKEQELIDDLMPVLDRLTQRDVKIDQGDYRTVLAVMDRMTILYPDDFDLQLRLTQSMAAVEKAIGPDAGGSAVTNSRLLASKFSGQARAHELLGRLTVDEGGPVIEALRAFGRCLDLDPSNLKCKDGFKATAKTYTAPHCVEFHKTRFGLHAASDKQEPKGKPQRQKVKVQGQTLFMDKTPALTGSDVDEILEGIDVVLTPRGAGRFADLTTQLAGSGYLVAVVDGKAKHAPKVMSPIDTGRFRLAEPVDLKRLCKKMAGEKLPPDLAKSYDALR